MAAQAIIIAAPVGFGSRLFSPSASLVSSSLLFSFPSFSSPEDFRRLFLNADSKTSPLVSVSSHSSTVLRKQFVAGHERRFHLSPALRLRRDVCIVQIFRRFKSISPAFPSIPPRSPKREARSIGSDTETRMENVSSAGHFFSSSTSARAVVTLAFVRAHLPSSFLLSPLYRPAFVVLPCAQSACL